MFQERDNSGYKYPFATRCTYHKFRTKGQTHRYLARTSLLQFNCVQSGKGVKLNSGGISPRRRHRSFASLQTTILSTVSQKNIREATNNERIVSFHDGFRDIQTRDFMMLSNVSNIWFDPRQAFRKRLCVYIVAHSFHERMIIDCSRSIIVWFSKFTETTLCKFVI